MPILLSSNRQSFMKQVLQGEAAFSAAEFAQEHELLVHGAIRVTEDNSVLLRRDGPLAPTPS